MGANHLAISVFATYEEIVTRCCEAWNFFANDIVTVRSITTREYVRAVKGQGRWFYNIRRVMKLNALSAARASL